jgi:hypothetical protein
MSNSAGESLLQDRTVERLRARLAQVSSRHIGVLWILASVVVASQKFLAGAYNNYLVFIGSLKVLFAHGDLYAPHPELYGDLFKYSPTFPLFMAPFIWQPLPLGLVCWGLLNAVSLYAAITRLWPAGDRRAVAALSLVTIELVGSLQHTQSNALVAALIIMAFVELERERSWRAGFYVAAGFFLKGYGAAAGALSLLYPTRFRAIGATAAWFVLLAAAPLAILSVDELVGQYRQWLGVRGTFAVMRNMSLMRVVQIHLGPSLHAVVVQAIGGIVFLLPFLRVSAWHDPRFRLRLLCSLLIALVLFNNAAEPPTYVIALAGCAIWYASDRGRTPVDRWLTVSLLLAIQLVSTDAYPRSLRGIAGPWTVKTVGCFVIWLRINWELLTGRYADQSASRGGGNRRSR